MATVVLLLLTYLEQVADPVGAVIVPTLYAANYGEGGSGLQFTVTNDGDRPGFLPERARIVMLAPRQFDYVLLREPYYSQGNDPTPVYPQTPVVVRYGEDPGHLQHDLERGLAARVRVGIPSVDHVGMTDTTWFEIEFEEGSRVGRLSASQSD